MQLYYDNISKMFTLDTPDDVIFLGPIDYTMLKLKHDYDLTISQAREAVLRAIFNNGDAVSLQNVTRMAKLITKNGE